MSKLIILAVLIILTVTTLYWFPKNLEHFAYKSGNVESMFSIYPVNHGNQSGIDLLSFLQKDNAATEPAIFATIDDLILTTVTTQQVSPESRPLILEWNLFLRRSLFTTRLNYLEKHCPFKCAYTTNHSEVDNAAVTIHHMGQDRYRPEIKSINQSAVTLFLNFEPPPHRDQYWNVPSNFFDYTITYRQDSDYPIFYDSFVPLSGPNDTNKYSDVEINGAVTAKKNPALWMVSHCSTPSKREKYVKELKKHIDVNQVGSCNHVNCAASKNCEKELIKTHYFYIAFENSVCIDYITEKFFRMRKLIVPIVLDRRVFRGVHEKLMNYTIFASDYNSPKHLAEYLKFLMNHPEEYRKYFDWAKVYKKSPQPFVNSDTACKICELANQVQNGIYQKKKLNVHEWWGGKTCFGPVGSDLAKKEKLDQN